MALLSAEPCEVVIDGDEPYGEELAQARSGLAAEHGGLLELDVASAAASILAAQGALAVSLGRRRGLGLVGVETSVLAGALVFLSHRLPIATAGATPPADPELKAPGPPFATRDGAWVEFEVLRYDQWCRAWAALGVRDEPLESAWSSYALRYLTGRCALDAALHAATRRHTVAELRALVEPLGVAVARLRTPDEVDRAGYPEQPWTFRKTGAGAALPPASGDAPLSGLCVVELATRLQGPLAGLLLRELGAHVVKVEPPGGDMGRAGPSPFGRAAYLAYNRGKEVIELDLKTAGGRHELHEITANADVFLHNSRPGRAERSGYGADELTRANPGLVYAHASGWGGAADAPSEIAGDYIVQAHAGLGASLRPAGEPPFPCHVTLVDVTGGLLACEAILAGLLGRAEDGASRVVGTSLLAAALELRRQTSHSRAAHDPEDFSRLIEVPSDPDVAPLLERIDEHAWAPAAPWRFVTA